MFSARAVYTIDLKERLEFQFELCLFEPKVHHYMLQASVLFSARTVSTIDLKERLDDFPKGTASSLSCVNLSKKLIILCSKLVFCSQPELFPQ